MLSFLIAERKNFIRILIFCPKSLTCNAIGSRGYEATPTSDVSRRLYGLHRSKIKIVIENRTNLRPGPACPESDRPRATISNGHDLIIC